MSELSSVVYCCLFFLIFNRNQQKYPLPFMVTPFYLIDVLNKFILLANIKNIRVFPILY